MNFVKSEYTHIRDFYRKDFREVLKMTATAFVVLVAVGFIAGMFFDHIAEGFVDRFTRQMADMEIVQNGHISAFALFSNNLRATFYTVLYGFIPFIFLPALSLGLNSLLLGMFAAYYIHHDLSVVQYFAGILPHGIFELPAIIIAIALGLYLCRQITDFLRHKTKGIVLPAIGNVSRTLLFVVAPLLAVASLIEAYVTPMILSLF